MSSKVKQANFRLPLEYMDLIDEISKSQGITKAAVITKALDSLKASIEGGGQSGTSEKELKELQNKLAQAESKVEEAARRAASAEKARDAAEAKAREAAYELLCRYNEDPFHIAHGETLEGLMRYYAEQYDLYAGYLADYIE